MMYQCIEIGSPESCLSATKRVVAIAEKYSRKVRITYTTTLEMEFLKKKTYCKCRATNKSS